MDRARLAALFDQALDLPEPERASFVAEVCADDDVARRELERWLRADFRASTFLESPAALFLAGSARVEVTDPAPPQAFGVYRVLRPLGSGGMGEVWLAERSDGEFEQRVAIKQLSWPTPGLLQRFRQERQILARLEHANIARLIDGGVDAVGVPYLVMEYVEGVPITAYAQQHAMDLHARLRLFLCVCEAVQYAHRNLVVHRDLKPSNIFVTADGVPKLLDFGIAKVLATTASAETQTLARMLTPDYAAPEQFDGGAITTATDVYALGVVLYELLAGARPVRATTADSSVAPPSAALARSAPAAQRRALRGDLDRIALVALEREPARRYASVEALAADIRSHLAGRAIAARGDSATYRLRKFVRRHRLVLAAVALAFVACATAAIVSIRQAQIARAQARRAETVKGFLLDLFALNDPARQQGATLSARDLVDLGARRAEAGLRDDTDTRIELLATVANLYESLGEYPRAATLFQQRLALASERYASNDLRIAEAQIELAESESQRDNHAAARALLTQSLDRFASASGMAARVRARALAALARVEFDSGNYMDAQARIEQSIELWRRVQPAAPAELAGALAALGRYRHTGGGDASAEAPLREALALLAPLHDAAPTTLMYARHDLALVLSGQRRFDEARAQVDENLALALRVYGERHPNVADLWFELGRIERLRGQGAAALEHFQQALAIYEQAFGANHSYVATTLTSIGQTLGKTGRHAEAIAALERAARIYADTLGPAHLYAAVGGTALAQARLDAHDYDAAESGFRAALRAFEAGGNGEHIYAQAARAGLGETLVELQRYVEAEPLLRNAHGRLVQKFGAGDARAVGAAITLARCLAGAGRPDDALRTLADARAAIDPHSEGAAELIAKVDAVKAAPGAAPSR